MVIVVHIASAALGIIGVYLNSFYLYRNLRRFHNEAGFPVFHFTTYVTVIGLAGVIVSGILLFARNPVSFFHSATLLSNMTVMVAIVFSEIMHFRIKNLRSFVINRAISLFSWSWVFLMALLHPPFSYIELLAVYTIGAGAVGIFWGARVGSFQKLHN